MHPLSGTQELPTVKVPPGRFNKCVQLDLRNHPQLQEVMTRRFPGYILYEDPILDDYFVVNENDETLIVDFRRYEHIDDPFDGVALPSSRLNDLDAENVPQKNEIERQSTMAIQNLYVPTHKGPQIYISSSTSEEKYPDIMVRDFKDELIATARTNVRRSVVEFRPLSEIHEQHQSSEVVPHRCVVFGDELLKKIVNRIVFPESLLNEIASFVFMTPVIDDAIEMIGRKSYPNAQIVVVIIGSEQFSQGRIKISVPEYLMFFMRSLKRHRQLGVGTKLALCEILPGAGSRLAGEAVDRANKHLETMCKEENIEVIRGGKSITDKENELAKSITEFVVASFCLKL
ncbi:hypothetical protein ACOME3_003399 [Neoechinorhynchus agilis]